MIWICAVVVFEGFSVLIHLKVRDRALGVAWGDEFGTPLDIKPRTSHLRGQPPQASNSRALRVKGLSFITPPEVANTGPGVNRGSGGGARGCGFEERVGVHARTGGIQFT